ncbi:AAA family ATPase [Nocardioides sp. URHA0020]|uniref:AAA family ATPase n=1 Tax=Nocardioides sp. URHA0020 TaxID=1380392 RepID=UPI00048B7592|nr:AAA family ATPase [Nocardioides sp. URHA0020]
MTATPTRPGADRVLVGRDEELARLEAFLAGPGGGVLVLEGPAGIGKTALWRSALEGARARGRLVLVAVAFEGETGMPYAALADLLRDVPTDVLDLLPELQRSALRSSVLLTDHGHATDRATEQEHDERAVPAALLSVLRALPTPLVLALDDVQWLDPASAEALAFATRRLGDHLVKVLLTRRGDEASPLEWGLRDQTTSVAVTALDDARTRDLIRARVTALTRVSERDVIGASGGNPLYALELAALVARGGDASPLPTSIGAVLRNRLQGLDPDARTALLVLALSPGVRPAEVTEILGSTAVAAAVDAGVVDMQDDSIRPGHPLLAVAALELASPAAQIGLHRRLAETVADESRRVRHLAMATERPDEPTAALVADAASRIGAYGDRRLAVELAEHALRLTPPDGARRPERLVDLAAHLVLAGELDRAAGLLRASLDGLPAGPVRARGWLLLVDSDTSAGADIDRNIAQALADAGDDPTTRASVLAQRAIIAVFHHMSDLAAADEWCVEAAELAGSSELDPALVSVEHARGWVRIMRGQPSAPDDSTYASPVYSHDRMVLLRQMWRGELAAAREGFTALLATAEERAESESISISTLQLCELELRAGRWAEVDGWLLEWERSGNRGHIMALDATFGRLRALAAAGRGDVRLAIELADAAVADATGPATMWQVLEARRAKGLALLLGGDAEAAAAVLLPIWEHLRDGGVVEPGAFPLGPDLVEALAASSPSTAADVLAWLEAVGADHAWAAASALRSRGHLAVADRDDDLAIDLFTRAAAAYDGLGFRADAARSLVHAGAGLRRRRRMRQARDVLQRAVTEFDEIDSPGWSRWAQAELSRVGGRPTSGGELTAAEKRVAVLAALGRRNREVAAELFITESTVEATLSRVYAKLGIRSRTELAARLRR